LRSWVFVADIKDDFILGLDILRVYDASVDLRRRMLRLGQDEVPVRGAPIAYIYMYTYIYIHTHTHTQLFRYRSPC
jgi:hypothetical protein